MKRTAAEIDDHVDANAATDGSGSLQGLQALLHELPPENCHEVLKDGHEACEEDPDLSPGHNCCAVCAESQGDDDGKGNLILCDKCNRVAYCSVEHREEDLQAHSKVCALLAAMREADAIQVSVEEEVELVQLFLKQQAPAELKGWTDVLPATFKPVWTLPTRRRVKRARTAAKEGEAAPKETPASASTSAPVAVGSDTDTPTLSADAATATTPAPSAPSTDVNADKHAAADAAGADDNEADTAKKLAVQLAVSTSLLTYPYTLLYALRGVESVKAAAQRADAGAGLVVCVLGASDTGEIAQLSVWKVLELATRNGILLQFVGPEVPPELHGTSQSLGNKLSGAFWQGTYDELASKALDPRTRGQLPSALTPLPDVFVAYNPGLTCPDYDWQDTLEVLHRVFKAKVARAASSKQPAASSGPLRLPLLLTTNTQLEGEMERDMVRDCTWRQAAALQRNPFTALETLQSGTMANDLYRKNAWLSCFELLQPGRAGRGGASSSSLRERVSKGLSKFLQRMAGRVMPPSQ